MIHSILTKEKMVPNPLMVDNSLQILKYRPTIKVIRIFSVIGLLLSSLGLLFLGMYYNGLSKINRAMYIKLKYGHLIVDVSISGPDNVKMVIDIKTIEELVNIASRQNALLLHMEREKKHYYFIENEGTVYRYSFSS